MKILLRAYTQLNLGDDLFLHILAVRYPDAEFMLASETGDMYDKFTQEHPNVTAFGGHSVLYRALRRMGRAPLIDKKIFSGVDAVIYIGGSIFMENEDDRFCENLLMAETAYCAEMGVPYHILSCNFGPYTTEGYYNRMRECFKNCTEVCFRDSESYELFRDLSSVRFAPDASFALDIERPAVREDVLGVSLISYRHRKCAEGYAEEYMAYLEDTVRRHLESGGSAELFCFCEAEGDCEAAEALAARLGNDGRVSIAVYDGAAVEFTKRFISCGKILASRFHGIMLALMYGIPLIPHIYSRKTENVLRDAGVFGEIDTDNYKIYRLDEEHSGNIQKIWHNIDKLYKKI